METPGRMLNVYRNCERTQKEQREGQDEVENMILKTVWSYGKIHLEG
jgi:hypothetical protein